MKLQEQFENEYMEKPAEPYSVDDNPEQWALIVKWFEDYTNWLEKKIEDK